MVKTDFFCNFAFKAKNPKSIMVKKTRDKFIEVARSLFARKGVENTTMNDIATASDKGRRTIYTYFKSKREIFNAVIESESDDLLQNLNSIVSKPISPEQKLREYVATRMETMREIVARNGSLRAGFFRDVRKVDRARAVIAKKEISMLMHILHEGEVLGVFVPLDVKKTAIIITNSIHGFDVPYIRNSLAEYGIPKEDIAGMISDMVLNGIILRDQS
ncbi:MAG: TetR/AcrR family transcriptional regulator [Muribaculaceae bacterium]|nr:TetR/AcrR family transcriptional regulator [Muribaculaceae bacterium]